MPAGSPANSRCRELQARDHLVLAGVVDAHGHRQYLDVPVGDSLNLAATLAAPSIPWVLRVKQSTTRSGRWSVQMSAMSDRPVLLSIRT